MERPLLDRFLAHERPLCPGCKKRIEGAAAGECLLCGEILVLEVRSLNRIDWSDQGAQPVLLAHTILGGASAWAGLVAAFYWLALMFLPVLT